MNDSLAALRRDYDVNSAVPDYPDIQTGYDQASAKVTGQLDGILDIPYGPGGVRQTLDLFVPPSSTSAPVIMFIHGGYWHFGSKDGRRFPALPLSDRGIAFAPINYRLIPPYDMDAAVADARAAVAWLYQHAQDYGCDPQRIFVAGNSAGGHLVGMLLALDWQHRAALPNNVVKGGCAVSGVFDLHPLADTHAHEWLQLDPVAASRNSPIEHLPDVRTPVIVAWGGDETHAFKQQSQDYAAACQQHGLTPSCLEMTGHNHFSVIGEFGDPASPLFTAITEMVGTGR